MLKTICLLIIAIYFIIQTPKKFKKYKKTKNFRELEELAAMIITIPACIILAFP